MDTIRFTAYTFCDGKMEVSVEGRSNSEYTEIVNTRVDENKLSGWNLGGSRVRLDAQAVRELHQACEIREAELIARGHLEPVVESGE